MKHLLLLLLECFLFFHPLLAQSLKDDLWYTVYEEAWESACSQGKPLYLLVASEVLDPCQLTLFQRLAIREVLKAGFVPLMVSPYEDIAFKLPIKTLPATFVISSKGKALLSYQGLLWESDFFQWILPLASFEEKTSLLNFSFDNKMINHQKRENTQDSQILREEELLKHTLLFEEGHFRYNGKHWLINHKHKERSLKELNWKVLDYFLLEDERKGVIYALPLHDKAMAYQMDKGTEIWRPFFIIEQK